MSEVLQFSCDRCGAPQEAAFDAEELVCGACGHVVELEEASWPVLEHDFREALGRVRSRPARELAPGARPVRCEKCGAAATLVEHSDLCPFCGSSLVVDPDDEETIVPEAILLHRFGAEEARAAFRRWLSTRWFAPGDLFASARGGEMDRVFLPWWTFDSRTVTSYRGRRGEHYHVTRGFGKDRRRVRRTRWSSRSGTVRVDFDDVLVPATNSVPPATLAALETWDLSALRRFDAPLLAGSVAERYRVGLEDGLRIAESRMEPDIRRAIRRDIGGDEQRILALAVRHDEVRFKLLLLPVWLSAYQYAGATYQVVVDASTGEVHAGRPYSALRVLIALALGLAVVLAFLAIAGVPR